MTRLERTSTVTADGVLDRLSQWFILRDVPGHLRSDCGSDLTARMARRWMGAVGVRTPFRSGVTRHWLQALRRRGQRGRLNWERFRPLVDFWLPRPVIRHPYPTVRFDAKHPR